MSVPTGWRQFQLFDYTPIKDPNYATEEPLYSDPSLSSLCATNSYLICSSNSFIKIISKEFKLLKTYLAYEAEYVISFIKEIPRSNLLVTIGERQGYPSVLKLWDLNKILHVPNTDNDALIHKFQTKVQINNENNSYPISCLTFNEDLTCVAVGYTNGRIILIRGDLIRDRGSKQRLIYESNDPITGIHYNKQDDLLYVTTTSKILTFLTNGRNQGKPFRILSNKTRIDLYCSDVDPKRQELIVGTPELIRYFTPKGKGHTISFEIPKRQIFRFGENYLLIVSPYEERIESTKSRKSFTRILIIDLLNKHISFNLSMPNITVNRVILMWDDIYYLTSDGILYKLHEKPINQQIELLLQREMFPIAYNLAIQSKLSVEILLNIQKEYGNFLYEKQDNDESIKIFNKCLKLYQEMGEEKTDSDSNNGDSIEEFIMNIITKFKDAANIKNLTEFLYELFNLNLANNDHITLLLSCYCKLKMRDELDIFIDRLDLDDTSNLQDLNFQLIINLFKECGYFQQVIKLLYKLNQPALIVGIQLNELNQPLQSLNYIKTLSIDELLLILIEHSKTLLDYLPIETTELLIKVFTGAYIPLENKQNLSKISEIQKAKTDENAKVISPLNSYKAFLTYLSGGTIDTDIPTESDVYIPKEPTYLPPKPNLIFPSFIDNPNEFVIFLEACLDTFERYQGNVNDKKDLLVTLLEMYLSLSKKDQESDWIDKAKALVDQHSHLLDKSSLLLVAHIYDFKEGEIISIEESGYEESLFRTAQLSNDIEGCFNIIYKHGDSITDLYRQMLKFMVSKEEIFTKVSKKDFQFILDKIKTLKLATPLEIIQILSNNNFTTIDLVRDYLIEFLENQNKEISNNLKLIEFYEAESTKNDHELTELVSKPFVIQNNKCSTCQLKLDFPMVHFKCKHSFHQKCINENFIVSDSIGNNIRSCPLCVNELDEIKSIRNLQLDSKNKTTAFKSSLDDATDKFKFISEYLGNGVMENECVTLINK